MSRRVLPFVAAAVAIGALAGSGARAQHVHSPAATAPATPAPAPVAGVSHRVTMAELHANRGVPRGWTFTVEPGDVSRGRALFADLECYKCHAVDGAKFPLPKDGKYAGPELTGMGRMHPAEYMAESILFPNRVIVDEPGYTGPDGRSVMPSYADSLTVTQWLDLVAYVKSLTEGGEHAAGHGIERETTAGEYRIRVVYVQGGHDAHADGHMTGGHAGHAPGDSAGHHGHPASPTPGSPPTPGHLMAFITARETGEAVPYLPVSVTATVPPTVPGPRAMKPMVSDRGFHYGADFTLPEGTSALAVAIGPTTMQVTPTAKGRFTKPVTAIVDWSAAPR